MRIGILTCDKCPELSPRDKHLPALFAERNVQADIITWSDPNVNWKAFDGLLFRSVWDYHLRSAEFNSWLNYMAQLGVKTLNSVEVVRNNQHKFYLQHLQSNGIEIVPTVFIEKTDNLDLSFIEQKNWRQAVIKPAISASSYLTTLFTGGNWQKVEAEYRPIAIERELLVQPFMPEVIDAGEVSLIFLNRKYSHAVLKRADIGEFRVQAEFGGRHAAFIPESNVIQTAEQIISLIKGSLLYARVDGLLQNGRFILMELEMLEPDLYFDVHTNASASYVDAAISLINCAG